MLAAAGRPPLRAAVIGCGAIGSGLAVAHADVGIGGHAQAYRVHPRTRLVAVGDTHPSRAHVLATREGCAAFTDLGELLATAAPEVISVATPDATHAGVIAQCLRAPTTRAVLAEKPLATTLADALALQELAASRGTVLAVNYSRRYSPVFAGLPGVVTALGGIRAVQGKYVKGLAHNGSHWLDLLRMLAGEPVTVRGHDRLGEGGDDPTLDAVLTLPGGATAQLVGLSSYDYTVFEMDLLLGAGRIRIEESGHVVSISDVGEDRRHPGYRVLQEVSRHNAALKDVTLLAVDDVVHAVEHGRRPRCDADDGRRALHLVDRIQTSAAGGGAELPC